MMEEVNTSETSINFYEITQHSIPDDCHIHGNLSRYLIYAWSTFKAGLLRRKNPFSEKYVCYLNCLKISKVLEQCSLRIFQEKVKRRIFGHETEKVTEYVGN